MIPISVSDIIKILDQIPIWKSVRELPKRVTELESRLAALENATKAQAQLPKPQPGRECPLCGAEMKVTAERPHPQFDFAGAKIHDMECACGNKAERQFTPGKGYR
jgi:hypothetical protein